jgi:hypothetical protein
MSKHTVCAHPVVTHPFHGIGLYKTFKYNQVCASNIKQRLAMQAPWHLGDVLIEWSR